MVLFPPAAEWHRRVALALLIGAVLPLAALAQGPRRGSTEAAAAITAITLEVGGGSGSTLVLRRDGTATLTRTGQARHGTEDQVARGAVRRDDFAALARLALSLGVLEMEDVYQDPTIADGNWATVSVARGAQTKQVFRREDAGPDSLRQFERAIEALQARITFVPDRR